jgi:hypothetical protein
MKGAMSKKRVLATACAVLVSTGVTGALQSATAQTKQTSYVPAPLDSYLIPDRNVEIASARSAAPRAIADDAEVLVLTRSGYATAVKGTNGFVCMVERSWAKTTDDPEFWNPKMRAPICVNAAAARTYLPLVLMKTRLALAGTSTPEIARTLDAALDSKDLPPLEANAMCYMMSREQYLSDEDTHWHPHMMWFVPGDAMKTWGANQPGTPALAGYVSEDRMTVFMVVVRKWSDGTLENSVSH